MRGDGAIEFQPPNPADVVDRIGQVYDVRLDIGLEVRAVGLGRAQEEVPPPERPQIEIQLALDVDEQRAAPLLLEHGTAVVGLEVEIVDQVVEVAPVGLGAEVSPAAQAAEGKLGEQLVDVVQHRAQAARGPGGKLVNELQVLAQQIGVAEAPRGGRQAGEHQRDDLAGGHGGELHGRADGVANHVFTNLLDNQRHLLEVGHHEIGAAAQAGQSPGALQVVLQAGRRHDARGLVKRALERIAQLGRDAFEEFAIIVEVQ